VGGRVSFISMKGVLAGGVTVLEVLLF